MSESGNYEPAPQWQGHDFASARGAYDAHAGRSYKVAQEKGLTANKLLPESIETKSPYPLEIDTDFTGSMSGWDATIFSKFPYLDHELRTEYLGEDMEVSFGAICDSTDTYPLQIRKFAKGVEMKETISELVHAGGGSGSDEYHEAHGLAALYRLRNVKMPNALGKPVYIIITDEMPHHRVSVEQARQLAKVHIEKAISIDEIFAELMLAYSVYVILKPYGHEQLLGDELPHITRQVCDRWKKIVGADRIAMLPNADRVVDVIFGIMAKETNKIEYFRKELERRQLPDPGGKEKVKTVYQSLKTIHALPKPDKKSSGKTTGHSHTTGVGHGKPTSSLI